LSGAIAVIDNFYIAWKYICFNKAKTITLIACVTIITFLPVSLQLLLNESETQLMSRAVSTPLIIGARGSSLDLAMNTLYFGDETPEPITMEASQRVAESQLARPIPVYIRFHARGYPIVGTTLDYFDYRKLKLSQGRQLATLGDCLLGETVARQTGLKPGDSITSSPENLFDLAGIYPLKMKVAGILTKSHTSDDKAIFVDIKTAWIIQGLGHGHTDVTKTKDTSVILKKSKGNVIANAKLKTYMEITNDNRNSFHFHDDPDKLPISAVIAIPHDSKSETILRGRYLSAHATQQIIKPKETINGLLENIFRIKNVLDAIILLVGTATILAIILIFALSLRLRQREIKTIFKLGSSRMTITKLLAAEILLIIVISGVACSAFVYLMGYYNNDLVRVLFIR
jgi:putative ABC transport system permease protein